MKKEDSLLAQVLMAKNYPNHGFLGSYIGHAPSFSWRGIWSTKNLLMDGLMWCVGNGDSTKVWSDRLVDCM